MSLISNCAKCIRYINKVHNDDDGDDNDYDYDDCVDDDDDSVRFQRDLTTYYESMVN